MFEHRQIGTASLLAACPEWSVASASTRTVNVVNREHAEGGSGERGEPSGKHQQWA
jgi:hypothetical protein